MMLYDYGPAARIWRGLMVLFTALAAVFLLAGLSASSLLMLAGATALLAPTLFFGAVVAVRAERLEGGLLEIQTLLFWRRRIASDRLGTPRVRIKYRSIHGDLAAPRMWVPVKGRLPVYFDLRGRILNRQAFLAAVRLQASELRLAERSPDA